MLVCYTSRYQLKTSRYPLALFQHLWIRTACLLLLQIPNAILKSAYRYSTACLHLQTPSACLQHLQIPTACFQKRQIPTASQPEFLDTHCLPPAQLQIRLLHLKIATTSILRLLIRLVYLQIHSACLLHLQIPIACSKYPLLASYTSQSASGTFRYTLLTSCTSRHLGSASYTSRYCLLPTPPYPPREPPDTHCLPPAPLDTHCLPPAPPDTHCLPPTQPDTYCLPPAPLNTHCLLPDTHC